MAARTPTIRDIKIVEGGQDAGAVDTVRRIKAIIYFDNGATAVTTGADTLDLNVATALAQIRSGATFTLRSYGIEQPAADATRGLGATMTVSTNTITMTLVDVSDWSTGRTLAASGAVRPFGMFVLCDVT